ncbi:hypothetical protein GW915_10715 [bacterium]|nr:hypothetical protein [bacterium]
MFKLLLSLFILASSTIHSKPVDSVEAIEAYLAKNKVDESEKFQLVGRIDHEKKSYWLYNGTYGEEGEVSELIVLTTKGPLNKAVEVLRDVSLYGFRSQEDLYGKKAPLEAREKLLVLWVQSMIKTKTEFSRYKQSLKRDIEQNSADADQRWVYERLFK